MRKLMITLAAGALAAFLCLPAFADNGTTTTVTTTVTVPATTTTTTTPTTTTTTPTTTTTTPTTTTGTTTVAQTPSSPRRNLHWFAGTATAVSDSSITVGVLWTGPNDGAFNGQNLTVSVPTSTRIFGPRHRPIALGQIQVGDLVSVRASGTDASSLTAVRIQQNCNCHWVGGTISALASNTVSVSVKRTGPFDTVLNNTTVNIATDGNTVYLQNHRGRRIGYADLKVGEGVGVVFSADGFFKAPGFNPATAHFDAKRIHVWGVRQVPPPSSDAASAASVSD